MLEWRSELNSMIFSYPDSLQGQIHSKQPTVEEMACIRTLVFISAPFAMSCILYEMNVIARIMSAMFV